MLRTERARRSALVEIDAVVAVWLGMDVEALIAIYQAAFPVHNRYEEITWFDANGWKLAGYHRTNGQIQQKDSREPFQEYLEASGKNPVPDGYTARSTRPTGSPTTARRTLPSALGWLRRILFR